MLEIPSEIMKQIQAVGEKAYPEEGAGFLLGQDGPPRRVQAILPLPNAREEDARKNRYLITSDDMLGAERDAEARKQDIIGVFHSHPDHPNRPSSFDLNWALPWFSYLITTVVQGRAGDSRAWRLAEDRSSFEEEPVQIELLEEKIE
jgi:proteasome lid subunit RPN8/RPN11